MCASRVNPTCVDRPSPWRSRISGAPFRADALHAAPHPGHAGMSSVYPSRSNYQGIGAPLRRVEDRRLLLGRGRFVADIELPGALACVLVRSPHAHARIRSIDTAAAMASPGVVAVFTGADMAADGMAAMRPLWAGRSRGGSAVAEPPRLWSARGTRGPRGARGAGGRGGWGGGSPGVRSGGGWGRGLVRRRGDLCRAGGSRWWR